MNIPFPPAKKVIKNDPCTGSKYLIDSRGEITASDTTLIIFLSTGFSHFILGEPSTLWSTTSTGNKYSLEMASMMCTPPCISGLT